MSNHTPGPWEVSYWCDGLGGDKPAITASGATIAITHPAPICPIEECKANANLIAAAPDMYEALEDIGRGKLQGPGDFEIYVKAVCEKALSKARGE